MRVLASNLLTALRLSIGASPRPSSLSETAGSVATLLVLLAVIGAATSLDRYAPLAVITILPLFCMLAALCVAAIAVPASAVVRGVVGVLAIAAISAIVALPLAGNLWSGSLPGISIALVCAGAMGFVIGIWRLTGQFDTPPVWRRLFATLASLVLTVAGVAWPTIANELGPRLSTMMQAQVSDEEDIYARYQGLAVEDALIDQSKRIDATFAALPLHGAGPETFVLAVGGSGFQVIFDREARVAASVLSAATAGPALMLSNSPEQVEKAILASPKTVALVIAAIGKRAVPGDMLLLYLTSHGGDDASIQMSAPWLGFDALTATALADDLRRAGIDKRIVIVSACYGASWVKPLATPSTIIVAAAAADRTSFGCDDTRELTVFGEALLGELRNRRQSYAQSFDRAKRRIARFERTEQVTPSLPQAWIGNKMTTIWSGQR